MGCYINPKTETKESFLLREGQQLSQAPRWKDVPSGFLPVVLVQNTGFTAAGVAFNEKELAVFAKPTERPEMWFLVEIQKLWDVSDLDEIAPYLEPPIPVPTKE
jgi:hypothetical protein